MDSSKKLYISLAVLGALAGGVYLQKQDKKKDATSHSLAVRQANLPKLELDEEVRKTIDTIEISTPGEEGKSAEGETPAEDAKPALKVVLKKVDDDKWELAEPVAYAANSANIKSLLENLGKLKVQEQISASTDAYTKWKVDDETGLHTVVKHGDKVLMDVYFGDSGSRGQMARIAGNDGVYAVKGYSKYLYERDAAGWRDKVIFKFEEKDAESVRIKNEHGEFEFAKTDGKWTGKLNGAPIPDFKPSKVDDMLRAYKSLNASDFGDDKTEADVGLGEPAATVTIGTKDSPNKYELAVGNKSEGESRWVKATGSKTIFSISSWSAEWATADAGKFQEKKDGDAEAKTEEKTPAPKAEKKAEPAPKPAEKKTEPAPKLAPPAPAPEPSAP